MPRSPYAHLHPLRTQAEEREGGEAADMAGHATHTHRQHHPTHTPPPPHPPTHPHHAHTHPLTTHAYTHTRERIISCMGFSLGIVVGICCASYVVLVEQGYVPTHAHAHTHAHTLLGVADTDIDAPPILYDMPVAISAYVRDRYVPSIRPVIAITDAQESGARVTTDGLGQAAMAKLNVGSVVMVLGVDPLADAAPPTNIPDGDAHTRTHTRTRGEAHGVLDPPVVVPVPDHSHGTIPAAHTAPAGTQTHTTPHTVPSSHDVRVHLEGGRASVSTKRRRRRVPVSSHTESQPVDTGYGESEGRASEGGDQYAGAAQGSVSQGSVRSKGWEMEKVVGRFEEDVHLSISERRGSRGESGAQ